MRHRLLKDDVYSLPIAAKLPRGYMLPFSEGREDEQIHFRHGGAKCFNVRIRVQSSIFNTDDSVNQFIQTFPNVKELQAVGHDKGRDLCQKAVEAIPKADPLLAIRFLPSIADHLMDLLMTRPLSFQSQLFAFQALTLYIHRISDFFNDPHRCPLIVAYITYRLDNHSMQMHSQSGSTASALETPIAPSSPSSPPPPPAAHPPLYAVMAKVWLAGLSSKDATAASAPKGGAGELSGRPSGASAFSASSSSPERLYVLYSWFYFECMAKSMGLERCESGALAPVYRDEFLQHFEQLVDVFVSLVCRHRSIGVAVVRQLVMNLAAFLLDLLAVVEKEAVLALIERFVVPLRSVGHDPVLLELKFVFHSILLDYPLYWDVAELKDLDLHQLQRRARERLAERTEGDIGGAGEAAAEASTPSSAPLYRELLREELLLRLRSDYRLCALLIDDFVHHLSVKEPLLRDAVVDCLRLFLTKTDFDHRWRSAKPLIAQALFPLIPALCDEVEVVTALEPRARRNVLLPFMWILHQLPPTVLLTLWQCEEAGDQVGLLTLLTCALNDFAYAGIKAREADQSTEPPYILAAESVDHLLNHSLTQGKGGGEGGGAGGAAASSGGGGGGLAAKRDLEQLLQQHRMYSRKDTFGGSKGRLVPATAQGGGGASVSTGPGALPRRESLQYHTVSGYPSALSGGGGGVSGVVTVTGHSSSASPSAHPPLLSSSSFGNGPSPLSSRSASPALGPSSASPSAVPPVAGAAALTSSPGGSVSGLGVSGSSGTAVGGSGSPAMGAGSLRRMRKEMQVATITRMASTLRGSAYRTMGGGASLSSVHRELVMNVVRFEGALTRQVGRVALNVLSRFLRFFAPQLPSSEAAFLEVLRCFTALFSNPQPNSFLLTTFPVVLLFIRRYGPSLHSTAARRLDFSRLSNAVFRTASFSSRAVRKHAVCVVYLALINEFSVKRNLTGLQTQFTMELSRMTDGLTGINERCLQQTFSSLTLLCDRYGLQVGGLTESSDAGTVEFRLCLQTLLGRLTTILGDSMEISRQSQLGDDADSAITQALLCQVADAFSHLPEVRIEWLKRLAKHHQQHSAYAEVGQNYLLIAQLAAQRKREEMLDVSSAEELETMDRLICSYYEAAVSQLDLAELYEQCSDVYSALLPYYHHAHDYHRLTKAHLHLHHLFEKVTAHTHTHTLRTSTHPCPRLPSSPPPSSAVRRSAVQLLVANSQQARMLGSYYRVGFYGHRFGPRLDGREFIYKTPKITRLMEMVHNMRSLYSKQLSTPVRILQDSNPVDRSKLDAEECVLQVTFVTPFFGSGADGPSADDGGGEEEDGHTNDVARAFHDSTASPSASALRLRPTLLTYTGARPRVSFIEQHSFLSAFKFSTPFTSTGKAFGAVAEQQKRNTVLYVQHPFPAILTAQLVVRKTETVLSPIESATEDVNARTTAILDVIDSPHLNHKAVAQVIQGSIATQVHGGAREIASSFLAPADHLTSHSQPHQGGGGRPSATAGDEEGGVGGSGEEPTSTSTSSSASAVSSSPSSTQSHPSSSSSPPSSGVVSPSSRAKLRSALLAFLFACSRALEVNEGLCVTDADREWQSNMDRIYEQMMEEMKPFLSQEPLPAEVTDGERSHQGSDSSAASSSQDSRSSDSGGGGASSAPNSSSALRASSRRSRPGGGGGGGGAGPQTSPPLSVSFNT